LFGFRLVEYARAKDCMRPTRMDQDPDKQPKVFDLSAARKRQKTTRVDPSGRRHRAGGSKGRGPAGQKSIWTYLQFALFIAFMAYFMQLCSSGSMF
jgi:hypothetical protein